MEKESDQENPQQGGQRNPIKRAEKEKEFRTVGQMKGAISNPQEMYEFVNKYANTIKKVVNPHIKQKSLNIIDYSLNARGPDEDKIYVKHQFYRNNIRRGNTLIYDSAQKKAYWARRGLMKFFDISQSSLAAIANEDIQTLSKKDNYNHYAVFTQIQNALSCNEDLEQKDRAKCHVYRLNKANGENSQVSYFKQTDEWIISSKNVPILIKSIDDIKKYDGERYQFAKLIAQTWFNVILKQKTKNQIAKLKQGLQGKTIVGQYCGNPDFQHLVKYGEVTIYFYAVVQYQSPYTCIPPPQAFKFFQEHGIPVVKNHENSYFGKFTSFTQLGKGLLQLFSDVSRSSIFQDQEGSVIYFVLQKPKVFCQYISDRYLQKTIPIPDNWQTKQIWWNTTSLGKLKTLEYRILRKLRQKLKFFTRIKHGNQNAQKKQNDVKKFQQKYGSFQKQCYQLLKKQVLNKPIEYYFCIAMIAFKYVFQNRKSNKNLQLLNDHFLDFLSVIFWCVENKKQVTPALMGEWKLHEELRGQTWEDYSIEIVKDYENMLNQIVPKYAKIKKSMKIGEQEEQEQNMEKEPKEGEEQEQIE